jgi:hypothetical protein
MLASERAAWPDPVLAVKDAMDMHAFGKGTGYVAFSLQTGKPLTSSGAPSRAAARKRAEKYSTDMLLILEIQPDGMTYREASACLTYERVLASRGVRTPDALESEENSGLLSMPRTAGDRERMSSQLVSGRPLLPDGVPYANVPAAFRRNH